MRRFLTVFGLLAPFSGPRTTKNGSGMKDYPPGKALGRGSRTGVLDMLRLFSGIENAPPPPPGPPPPSGGGPESFEPRLRGCLAKAAQKVYPTPTWPSPPGEGGQVGVGVRSLSPTAGEGPGSRWSVAGRINRKAGARAPRLSRPPRAQSSEVLDWERGGGKLVRAGTTLSSPRILGAPSLRPSPSLPPPPVLNHLIY